MTNTISRIIVKVSTGICQEGGVSMGSKLKIAILEAGYTKAYEFAEKMGISRQYLTMLETGKAKNPSRELMIKIAEALETDVQTLFFSED